MTLYKLSPFVNFIESHLIPNASQYAVFHRLTGQLVEPTPRIRSFLSAIKVYNSFSFEDRNLSQFGPEGRQLQRLIDEWFLIPDGADLLAPFVDDLVVRPLQNPSVAYRDDSGNVLLARISMAERVYSPRSWQLPQVIEERMPPLATDLFLAADGTKTLREIYAALGKQKSLLFDDEEFRSALDFLTKPERQLIKLTQKADLLMDPFQPANIVPRNFYHSSRWPTAGAAAKSIAEFHTEGIEDAIWEFDLIEPTVNHALRFPSELLGGLDYGARFCDATLDAAALSTKKHVRVLEIGGGTGSFARSFIERARASYSLSYQIMDLSPALTESQRRILSDVEPAVVFTTQDATNFDLPGQMFDLIIANEVIADFPVAAVEKRLNHENAPDFSGDGAVYITKYGLSTEAAPERFYVNAGVFQALECAWKHLAPGGALIVSEYGSESRYPVESFHLNHPEFTIHFGQVTECARMIGYDCRLEKLADFLSIDDRKYVLNGREEHIQCLNHVFQKYGVNLPFALFSEADFKAKFGELVDRLQLEPVRFLPLRSNFHYGPGIYDFFVLILIKRPA